MFPQCFLNEQQTQTAAALCSFTSTLTKDSFSLMFRQNDAVNVVNGNCWYTHSIRQLGAYESTKQLQFFCSYLHYSLWELKSRRGDDNCDKQYKVYESLLSKFKKKKMDFQ